MSDAELTDEQESPVAAENETAGSGNEPANPQASEPADGEATEAGIPVQSAAFQELAGEMAGPGAEIQRINEIRVQVSAELGRKEMTIQELLELHAGSVVELDRSIESNIELVAQGVALAQGEVVVVNNKFALKITKIYQNSRLGSS